MVRNRFYIEGALGALTAALAIITLAWHDWVEVLFKVDPDQFSGSFEWMVVAVSAILTAGFAFLARYEWQRAHAARS